MTAKAVTRIGDTGTGICPAHSPSPIAFTTTFNSASTNVDADGKHICIIGSTGISTCGHNTIALTGSAVVFADGIAVHRVGDTGIGSGGGTYTVVSGSPTTDAL